MRRPAILALATVAALTLAACDRGGTEEPPSQSSGDAAAPDDDEGEAPESDGPLWDHLQAIWGEEDEAAVKARQEQYFQMIADCMKGEGFEYFLPSESSTYEEVLRDPDGPGYGTREYAEQYGFGITEAPDDVMNPMTEEEILASSPEVQYLDSLSDSERTAYEAALNGPEMSIEEIDAMQLNPDRENDWKKFGCRGKVEHELGMYEPLVQDDPQFEDLFTALDEMQMNAWADAERIAMDQDWAQCFAAAGYPEVTSRLTLIDWVYERFYAIGDGTAKPSPEQRAEFQQFEIEIAVADWECAQEVNWDKRYEESELRMQSEFLDRHRAEIDAVIAKYATGNN